MARRSFYEEKLVSLFYVLALCLACLSVTALAGEGSGGTYTVRFDKGAEGVEGSMEDVTAATGENWWFPECEFTRIGYSFIGWNTKRDGSGTPCSDHATIQDQFSTEDKRDCYFLRPVGGTGVPGQL